MKKTRVIQQEVFNEVVKFVRKLQTEFFDEYVEKFLALGCSEHEAANMSINVLNSACATYVKHVDNIAKKFNIPSTEHHINLDPDSDKSGKN